jgi:hypothetical protein
LIARYDVSKHAVLCIKDAITLSYLVDVPGSWKRSLVPAGLAVENRGRIVATVADVVLNCEWAATL